MPNQFVLKCTHDSGGVVICNDKKCFDVQEAKKKLKEHLKVNYYYFSREWAYKNVKPRIIAEKYLVDESGNDLKDYKIHVFNGEPKIIQVDFGRFSENHQRNIYDTGWNYIPLSILYPTAPDVSIPKPGTLNEMLDVAKKLAEGIPYVRVDLYSVYDKVYFGELTLTHGSGFEPIKPVEWQQKLGDWIDISKVWGKK